LSFGAIDYIVAPNSSLTIPEGLRCFLDRNRQNDCTSKGPLGKPRKARVAVPQHDYDTGGNLAKHQAFLSCCTATIVSA